MLIRNFANMERYENTNITLQLHVCIKLKRRNHKIFFSCLITLPIIRLYYDSAEFYTYLVR